MIPDGTPPADPLGAFARAAADAGRAAAELPVDEWPLLADMIGADRAGNLLRLRVTAPGGGLAIRAQDDLLKAALAALEAEPPCPVHRRQAGRGHGQQLA